MQSPRDCEPMYDRIYRWPRRLRPEVDGPERVFLLAESGPTFLRGALFAGLAPALDGRRTVGELVETLADRFPAPMVLYGLMQLERAGHIASDPPEAPPSAAPPTLHVADLDVRPVVDLADPALAAYSAVGPWAAVALSGQRPLLSPIFDAAADDPARPCPACMRHGLMHNRPVERFLAHRRGQPVPGPPRPLDEAVASAAVDVFAAALTAALGDPAHAAHRAVARLEADGALSWHPVRRRPQCARCGDPGLQAARAGRPVILAPRPKTYTEDGGHRVCRPEATLARLAPLLDPLTGVVARLEPVAERHHPLRPVYSAAWRICPLDREPGFDDFDRPALGKGRTDAQARVGALCEALERYSSMWQGDEPVRRARFADLDDALHPDALQLYSPGQYVERDRINAEVDDPRKQVPPPFDDDRAIEWTAVWHLRSGQRRWVPAALCHPFRPAEPADRGLGFNPNGHAAGNCLEEAILQGLFERVERDAVSMWWYARCRRAAVDLDAMGDDWFPSIARHYAALGFDLWVLDLTTDLGIPVFTAIVRRVVDGHIEHAIGFGCHLDMPMAVQRALTELNQLFDPVHMPDPWDHAALPEADYIDPLPGARVGPEDFATAASDDITVDVWRCVDRLEAAGVSTLALDQTRPDIDLSVVKVLTPGLCHFWPRFGAERLYRVPVEMGWRAAPLGEADLNPVHLFL